MAVCQRYIQKFLDFFYPVKKGAPVNVEMLCGFRRVSVVVQIRPEGKDEFRMILPVVIRQLFQMMVDTHFQSGIIRRCEKVFGQQFRTEVQDICAPGRIPQFQSAQSLLIKGLDL